MEFKELVGQSLGRASVAWTETPRGVFDSEVCSDLFDKIMEAHEQEIEARPVTIPQAISQLVKTLREDPSYRISWQANIAMAFKDNWHWYMENNKEKVLHQTQNQTLHEIANKSADLFLNLLCKDKNQDTELPGMLALSLEIEQAR